MKVLFDARSVFQGMGGIGRATAALAREIPRQLGAGDELLILRTKGGHARAPLQEVGRARTPQGHGNAPLHDGSNPAVQELECEGAMIDPCFEQAVLPGLLEEHRVDLFHGTCFAVPVAPSTVAKVATVHDVVFRRHPELVDPRLADALDRATAIACSTADRIVTVSNHARGEIAALYGRDRGVVVVPNGVAESFLGVERRAPPDAPFILYVGSLERKKNVPALLRGFAALLRRAPELPHQLVLVGGAGGQAFDLEAALAEVGDARERVHVLGHVPEPTLHALYAAADAFVYLSAYEGFGLPPLEAMAAGVPTLVADRSSLPEVVGGAALRVNADDADEVSAALQRLLVDRELRATLAREGRERAALFRWETSARLLVELYREVLAERDGASAAPALRVLSGGKRA